MPKTAKIKFYFFFFWVGILNVGFWDVYQQTVNSIPLLGFCFLLGHGEAELFIRSKVFFFPKRNNNLICIR